MINIGIIEDHHIYRKGLISLFEEMEDCQLVMEAENGLDYIRKADVNPTSPNIIVIDMQMPMMDGFETLRWLRQNHPSIKCIINSIDDVDENVYKAYRSGAKAYITKNMHPDEIKKAIRAVHTHDFYYTEFFNHSIFSGEAKLRQREKIHALPTPAEKEYLRIVCNNPVASRKEIAALMYKSESTINDYIHHLFEKFEVDNIRALIIFAYQWGFGGIAEKNNLTSTK